MNLTKHIQTSIGNAVEGKSKLIPRILSLEGMSSARNRHLLNNILDMPDVNYLEIGVHKGSTFISALYRNKVNSSYAIDNWSQFDEEGNTFIAFIKNCEKNNIENYLLIEKDAFDVDLKIFKHKINVYFYDGLHSKEATAKALTYFYDILDDEFLFIVDDYSWVLPHEGVIEGIAKCDLTVKFKVHLKSDKINDKDGWWNGVGIFLLKKKK